MEQALKILVVEDEVIIAQDIVGALEEIGHQVLGVARDYDGALKALDFEQPDLVLADISLKGEKNGIDLAIHIRAHYHLPLVFLTSHSDSATVKKAVTTLPNGYLVKPFTEADLYSSISLAWHHFQQAEIKSDGQPKLAGTPPADPFGDSLFVKSGGLQSRIKMADILFLEADGGYTHIHCRERKHTERQLLSILEERLDMSTFMRVHRSFIINLSWVEGLRNDEVIIAGKAIPLGRTHRKKLLKLIR